MKKIPWFWILLFILVLTLLVGLATSWNIVLVKNNKFQSIPWVGLILGTLGFLTIVGLTGLIFFRLMKEMAQTQAQTDFLAKVSHELKSPITSLELTASLIKNKSLSEDEKSRLFVLFEAELRRLKTEVNLILETSRFENKAFQVHSETLHLENWLASQLHLWRGILGPSSELERKGPPLHHNVSLDPKLLDLVVTNILDNSRKFAMGGKPKVTLESRMTPSTWQLSFQDEGWGFDGKDSKKIFRRFYRIGTGAPKAIEGTGLGLYLAKNACKALNIELKALSPGRGKGATFILKGNLQ